ncbi:MAG: hypothetical protein ACRDQ4_01930 [Pseudonocardiaceae bacterium]
MKHAVNLILSDEPVRRVQFGGRPVVNPGVAVVCSMADGQLEQVGKLGMISRYRRRYEVDIADHHDTVDSPLPTRDDVYHFQCSIVVGWRVNDPIEVVRRRVGDGLDLCHSRLLDRMREISREFEIQDCAKAEREINRAVVIPFTLLEGITIYHFSARLTLDAGARAYLQAKIAAARESDLDKLRWRGDVERAHHDETMEGIRLSGEVQRDQQRMNAVRQALKGDNDLLLYHLAQNRGETGTIINMIRADRNSTEHERITLLKDLIDRHLIQDVDLDELRSELVSGTALGIRRGSNPTKELPSIVQQQPLKIVDLNGATESDHTASADQAGVTDQTTNGQPIPDSSGSPHDGSGVTGWKSRNPSKQNNGPA